jgi:hypothetical protein
MPPKTTMGQVERHGNAFRAHVQYYVDGRNQHIRGPSRAAREQAEQDLSQMGLASSEAKGVPNVDAAKLVAKELKSKKYSVDLKIGHVEQKGRRHCAHLQLHVEGRNINIRGPSRIQAKAADADLQRLRAAGLTACVTKAALVEVLDALSKELQEGAAAGRKRASAGKEHCGLALSTLMDDAYKDLTVETVDKLLAQHVDVDVRKDAGGQTLLMEAAWRGQQSVAQRLLEHGADVNACTAQGLTALHFACMKGHAALTKVLLKYGADPCAVEASGFHALHSAVLHAPKNAVCEIRMILHEAGVRDYPRDRADWASRRLADISEQAYFAKWSCSSQPPPEPGVPNSY